MKKQTLLYLSIIIVFIVCGILYIYKSIDYDEPLMNEIRALESNIELENVEVLQPINNVNKTETEKESSEAISITEENKPKSCTVYVCGEVREPNVYTLNEGSRINDVINIAGGALEEADLNQLNLAEIIFDSQKIYVPKKGEEIDKLPLKVENRDISSITNENSNVLININAASSEQLQTLSGIGAVIAQNIIEYREAHGSFSSIEEIQNVTRIGEKTYQKIKDKITIR